MENEARERLRMLVRSGSPNILEYNKTSRTPMKPIALVIDEVAEVDDQTLLLKHVKVNRAAGVYPIFATNDPTKSSVIAKSNLATRISFHVPSTSDSITGFGRPGANKLPRKQGRGLVMHNSRVTEFQSFVIDYPQPSEYAKQWLLDQLSAQDEAPAIEPTSPRDEIAETAERIREQWNASMSGSAVARLLGLSQYGGSYKARVDKVVEYLTSTLYSTTPKEPEMPVLGAVEA